MHTINPTANKKRGQDSHLVNPTEHKVKFSKPVLEEMVDLRITGSQKHMIDGLIVDTGKGREEAMREPIIARGQAHGTGAPVKRKGEPISSFSPRTHYTIGQYKVVGQN